MSRKRACEICGRKEGCMLDLSSHEPTIGVGKIGEPVPLEDCVPLGPVEQCEVCKRWACPDCLHECDCCFLEEDDHNKEPDWAPPGWRVKQRAGSMVEWERIET